MSHLTITLPKKKKKSIYTTNIRSRIEVAIINLEMASGHGW